jgi:hypothetical protein
MTQCFPNVAITLDNIPLNNSHSIQDHLTPEKVHIVIVIPIVIKSAEAQHIRYCHIGGYQNANCWTF